MLTAVLLLMALAPLQSGCSIDVVNAGLCSVTNTGTTVDITQTQPGGGSDGDTDTDTSDQTDTFQRPSDEECAAEPLRYGCTPLLASVFPKLTDVASFAPAALTITGEPGGFGVVGMPVNFVVDATVQETTGELFDLPVTVRFTPASIVWDYGDGTTRETSGGGRTWEQLGLPQFSATATGHAYAARGTYTASAIVRYSAQVNFGTGWINVPGLLEIPTTTSPIHVVEVRTALVDLTCLENPTGPGC
ncbi:hypothetical protein [Microbacterium sp.]|uniref:hypothetical protein n=1 Tax=Microbacterium sp. TaxID=51671 RepID=UPI0039E4E2FC